MSRYPPCKSPFKFHVWFTEQQTGHRHCVWCDVHKTKREERECAAIAAAPSSEKDARA